MGKTEIYKRFVAKMLTSFYTEAGTVQNSCTPYVLLIYDRISVVDPNSFFSDSDPQIIFSDSDTDS
jgi:hypothetical protein